MSTQQIGLLFVQFVLSSSTLLWIALHLLKAHEERYKYRLFAVRDKMLYLVATEDLSETSMAFKVFYRAMNTYVAELNSLTLVSFIRASMAVRSELERENQQRLVEAIQRSTPETQAVINEFIHVVMDALRYNSPMLHLLLTIARHCGRILTFTRKISRFPLPLYDTYRYYENIHGRFGLV